MFVVLRRDARSGNPSYGLCHARKKTLMIKALAALASAFLLVSAAAQAQQPSRLDDIIKRGTLRVGMTGDYLPFTSLDKTTQKFRGFDVDMAEALGKTLGVKVEFVQTAWPQMTRDSRPIISTS